jgi:hypothetical protein
MLKFAIILNIDDNLLNWLCHFFFGTMQNLSWQLLAYFRFWSGFGIGGNYLLSASINKIQGAFIARVAPMTGFGILGGGIAQS